MEGGRTYLQLATLLGVGQSTICRDVKAMLKPGMWTCPGCGTLHRDTLAKLKGPKMEPRVVLEYVDLPPATPIHPNGLAELPPAA